MGGVWAWGSANIEICEKNPTVDVGFFVGIFGKAIDVGEIYKI